MDQLKDNKNPEDKDNPTHPEGTELDHVPDQRTEDELLKSGEEDQMEPQQKTKKARVNLSGAAGKRFKYLLKHGLSHGEARQHALKPITKEKEGAPKSKGSKRVQSE